LGLGKKQNGCPCLSKYLGIRLLTQLSLNICGLEIKEPPGFFKHRGQGKEDKTKKHSYDNQLAL
jgi:hypothetical protein